MVMVFNNRHVPFLRWANLLAVSSIISHDMSMFNATAITVMVDRWRSETHSFHLPCSGMMVILEDVAMILGFPIRGHPVTAVVTLLGGVTG
jgi:hypothetical protein